MILNKKQNNLYILNSIFFSIAILSFFIKPDFNLKTFDYRFISYASSQAFDISKRVSFYFKIIGIFSFTAINFYIAFAFLNKYINKVYLYFITALSVFGIINLILYNIKIIDIENVKLVISFQLLILIYIVISNVFRKSKKFLERNFQLIYPFLVIFSIIIYFLSFVLYSKTTSNFPVFISIAIIFAILNLFFVLFIKSEIKFTRILYLATPFLAIPLLYFISTEISYYHKQNLNNVSIYVGIVILIIASVLLYFFKIRNKVLSKSLAKKIVYNFYLPIFLIGILIFEFYSPFISQNIEMFEKANPALSIQQFYDFCKIPFIDSFGSHSLSEIFFGFIYTLINGFDGFTYEIYNFFNSIIYYLLAFLLLRKITKSNMFAVLFVLLIPYSVILIPQYFYFSIISIFVLFRLLKKQSILNYFLFFTILVLSLLWRIDIGVAVIPSLILSFVIYFIKNKTYKIEFKKLIYGFLIFVLTLAPFFIFAIIKADNLFVVFNDILSYLSSAQTYGIPLLTYKNQDYIYYFHFIIFPALVIFSLVYAIYKLKFYESKNTFTLISIIFFSIYYLFNFQRGIVRHSFIEGWDTALSSYVFIILTLTFIDYLNIKRGLKYQITFLTISLIIILGFHYPQNSIDKKSNLNIIKSKFAEALKIDNNYTRIFPDSEFIKNNISEIKAFFDNNLDSNQTFIDFSNNPMLYFYLHRENPNYFNQPLLSNHSDYLQNRFIEQIKNYDIPFIVYSNFPKNWWDMSDNIPNNLRYYLISEYINKNYEPFAIISNKCIWKRKGFDKTKINSIEVIKNDSVLKFSKTINIKFLDTLFTHTISNCDKKGEILLSDTIIKINKSKKYLFKLKGNIYPYDNMILQYTTDKGTENQEIETKNTYFAYVILRTDGAKYIKNVKLILNKNQRFNFQYYTITEYNIIPDFYSDIFYYPQKIDLIPYVWGNMDKQITNNNFEILDTVSTEFLSEKGKEIIFNVNSEKIAKSNYLLISAKSNSDTYANIIYSTNYTNKGGYKFIIKKSEDFMFYAFRFSADFNWNKIVKKIKFISEGSDVDVDNVLLIKDVN